MTESPEVQEEVDNTVEAAETEKPTVTPAMIRKYLKMLRGGRKRRQTKGNVLPHIAKKKRQAQRAARKKNR